MRYQYHLKHFSIRCLTGGSTRIRHHSAVNPTEYELSKSVQLSRFLFTSINESILGRANSIDSYPIAIISLDFSQK
jgi:hypothetical protein